MRYTRGSLSSALQQPMTSPLVTDRRHPRTRWALLTCVVACPLLTACPLTDNYVLRDESGSAAGESTLGGASGAAPLDAGGGTPAETGRGGNSGNSGTHVGGAVAGGSGGAAPAGSAAGDIGSSGSAGALDDPFEPRCEDEVIKGSACTAASIPVCYRSCGPDNLGSKSETCQSGSYVEQSGCSFPKRDYSCYQVPSSLPPSCPSSSVPRGGQACQSPACTACFGGSAQNPLYEDSTGARKSGYCVCSDARIWTCASLPSWPCPAGEGC